MQDRNPISFFLHKNIIFPTSFTEETILSSLSILGFLVKY